ncbi:sec1 family domain-containing protein 2-like [Osmia bicornis bicornis]|uniref:sec1 family domain-containing protein 2-like n=1 Tax=Osmia bicornis bicornis TaxID=1437191 RepID=UPI0010F89107|nr:sec1 family domain-containing protein 2-like [Osmia bicornis bicornis]
MTDITFEVENFISECWANIFAEVYDTVVYMDHSAIECLHWYTAGKGYLTLKNAGAVAVYEFGMYQFQYVKVNSTKKAVIVSTSGDPAFYQRTIRLILAKNAFESCTVYCGAPCCTTDHSDTSMEDKLDYIKLKKDIKTWMVSENISQEPAVNITYMPLFIAHLNKNLFVTPPYGDLMPPLDGNIPNDTSFKLNLLAKSFHKLFDSIGVKLDIYSVGKLSSRLAESLESCTFSSEHKSHSSRVSTGLSLIFIDRTLDLCTPTSNNTKSFLTKVLRTFPRLPHHGNDIAIDMSPVIGAITGILQAYQTPGCLASMEEGTIDRFILQTEKELLAIANQSLNDISSVKDSPKLKTPVRISGHSLEKVLNKIQTINSIDSMMMHADKLQCILAIIETLTSQKAGQLELLTSLEKLALQNLSASRESSSILIQLSNIIRTRLQRGLDIENLLALLTHIYALAGTQIRFSAQQERQLEESIADAIFEDFQMLKKHPLTSKKSTYQLTLSLLEVEDIATAEETSRRIASRIICTLRSVAEQRSMLQDYRFCMIKPSSQEMIRHVSVLEQITKDIICSDTNRELRDLHQRPSSFISAGFNSILRGKAKHHPCDNPYVLIYIVGGITAEEAKIIQETISIHGNKKSSSIILAGSTLLNPLDIVNKIFFC